MKTGRVVKDATIIGCVMAIERYNDNEASAVAISTHRENYILATTLYALCLSIWHTPRPSFRGSPSP